MKNLRVLLLFFFWLIALSAKSMGSPLIIFLTHHSIKWNVFKNEFLFSNNLKVLLLFFLPHHSIKWNVFKNEFLFLNNLKVLLLFFFDSSPLSVFHLMCLFWCHSPKWNVFKNVWILFSFFYGGIFCLPCSTIFYRLLLFLRFFAFFSGSVLCVQQQYLFEIDWLVPLGKFRVRGAP